MILWTPLPYECIFPTKTEPTDIMEIDGGILEGKRTLNGFAVSRLISTDPKMFLKDGNAPGSTRKI